MRIAGIFGALSVGAFVATLPPAPASATSLTCSFSISNLNFGAVTLTTNTAYDTTSTFSANCSGGAAGSTARVCPNINAGTGGSQSGNPRLMVNGGNEVSYNLYQDAARTTVWGSYVWAYASYTAPTIDIALDSSGNGTATRTIYGRIFTGQQTLPPGAYSSSFSGIDTQIAYSVSSTGTCAQIGTLNATSAPFTASANYAATCTINATTLNFGAVGVLSNAVNGSSTLTTTCSASTPYNIGLDGGSAMATNPALRRMSRSGETITYGLYMDSARTSGWGNTIGTNTAGGVGTGGGQNTTVYGQVPAQATPAPGVYIDTIVATVTY